MGCCKICTTPNGCNTPILHQIMGVFLILLGITALAYILLYFYLVQVVKDKIKRGVYTR